MSSLHVSYTDRTSRATTHTVGVFGLTVQVATTRVWCCEMRGRERENFSPVLVRRLCLVVSVELFPCAPRRSTQGAGRLGEVRKACVTVIPPLHARQWAPSAAKGQANEWKKRLQG